MQGLTVSLASHWLPEKQQKRVNPADILAKEADLDLSTEYIDWSNMWTRLYSIATEKQRSYFSDWEEIFSEKNPDIYNIVLRQLIRASQTIRPILSKS